MSPLKRWLHSLAHVTGLWALVIALPVLDVLRRAPEFFVAHRADPCDVLAVTALVVGAGPLVLGGVLAAATAAGQTAADVVTALLVGLLLGVLGAQVGYGLGATDWGATTLIALASLALGALTWWRWTGLRRILTVLAWAAILVPVFFLSWRDIRALLLPSLAQVAARRPTTLSPVVLIVFDELPLVNLLDEHGQLDPIRYPHLAALAADGIWFRNATTVSDYTRWALPAILTGQYPQPDSMPTPGDHPHTLFTLLAPTHRMEVSEPLTALCPPQLSESGRERRTDRYERMLADLQVVAAVTLLPPAARSSLPDVTQDWAGFSEDDDAVRRRWRRGGRKDPYVTATTFIDGIAASDEQPTLYFLHSLVSHHPSRWLPSGQAIANVRMPDSLTRGTWTTSSWPVAQHEQAALLQAGLVDTLVGRLRSRLEQAGLYDRTLVVITADHGASFTPGSPMRTFSNAGAAGIVPVPLIVKLPAGRQRHPPGAVDDRNVETIDILPTIADALGVRLSHAADGTSTLGADARRPAKRVYYNRSRQIRTFHPAELARLRAAAVLRNVATFGTGRWPALAPAGLEGLVGRRLPSFTIKGATGGPRVQVEHTDAFEHVDLAAPALPVQVNGRVLGLDPQKSESVFLALSVNETIAATTRTWPGSAQWTALLPPQRLQQGRNVVEVFVVDPARPMTLEATRPRRRLPPALNLFSPDAREYGLAYRGFHHIEKAGSTPFHWTSGDAAITVPIVSGFLPSALEVDVLFTGRPGKRLRVLLDDCELLSESLPGGRWTRRIPLGACTPSGRWATVRFLADTHRPPRDARRLGVALSRVVLTE